METERMIRQLKHTANKHMHDTLRTFDTNITALCNDVIPSLEELKKYEDTGLTPERIRELDKLYAEKCRELAELRRQQWIPVTKRLPDTDDYIMVSFENYMLPDIARYEKDEDGGAFYPGDEEKSYVQFGLFVNAWMPLPEPYKETKDKE